VDRKAGVKLGWLLLPLVLAGALSLQDWWARAEAVAHLPYSQFRELVRADQVASVTIAADRIDGELKKPFEGKTRFTTVRVDAEIARELGEHGVAFSGRAENPAATLVLSWAIPVLLLWGLWSLAGRRAARQSGGLLSIGKSKAKVYVETDTKVTFADVAGVDEAKAELRETVEFLRDPKAYGRLGARMPRGVLLVGPPGTGKTLLARAVAGEAGVPFFSISGSEFVEMFVGVGAARVRDLFEQARQKAPCIIFVDELDALGRARGAYPGMGGHDEKEQTLNQLLVELDGFDPTSGIVLLAATNRPEVLDPALLRAGRFDRQVLVDRPDRAGRVAILRVHLRRIELATDVDPDQLAALTPGFTGADLANLVNEAALVATRRDAGRVEASDFTAAIERIVAGLEKRNRLLIPQERKVVAHHEMGHALVAAALPGSDPVHKVSIIPRGIGSLGYTIQRPTDDRYLMSRAELEDKIAVLLGGRAAEQVVFQQLSTGTADDLARATDIAMTMITRYAMVPELGNLSYDSGPPLILAPGLAAPRRSYSEQTAREIDCAARDIVDRGLARAEEILQRNRQVLLDAAALLLERETLDEAELEPLFARTAKEPPAAAA